MTANSVRRRARASPTKTTNTRTDDGREVLVHSTGSGPGVVVVHGSAVSSRTYRRLARRLSPVATVHLYDRHPLAAPYRLDDDLDTLMAVLDHTGSTRVLGHSYGGFVALRAGLRRPLDRLAVFDASISVDGSFPAEPVAAFRRAVDCGDLALAATVMMTGFGHGGPLTALPQQWQLRLARTAARTRTGRSWLARLPVAADELETILDHDASGVNYAQLGGAVLLAHGERSPAYFALAARVLAAARSGTSVTELPRAGHDAIAAARSVHIEPFSHFLAS